jgi:hypothetical protein
MSERGRWVKGVSGNSKGRPTSERALAKVLRATGEHDSYGDISNKALLARMIWEGLAWGKITFAGGKTLELTAREWLDMVKWVHAHVDGVVRPEPPEQAQEPPRLPTVYIYGPQEFTLEQAREIVMRELEVNAAEREIREGE